MSLLLRFRTKLGLCCALLLLISLYACGRYGPLFLPTPDQQTKTTPCATDTANCRQESAHE